MTIAKIGIIGGSGLYSMDALENVEEHSIDTPFGKPSGHIISGTIDNIPVVFLARHGKGHRLIPSEVPYQANIFALKKMGVRYLLSFSAVGSLSENMAPLDMVIPDQFIDLTKYRKNTFFGNGAVAHISMANLFVHRQLTPSNMPLMTLIKKMKKQVSPCMNRVLMCVLKGLNSPVSQNHIGFVRWVHTL